MSQDSLSENEDMNLPFEFRKSPVSDEQQKKNWNSIESSLQTAAGVPKRRWSNAIYSAAFVIIIVAGILFVNTGVPKNINSYKTGFAQTKSLTLPDGSKVILNANSSLRITADWTNLKEREVWLEGEAFFEVEKKPATNQKFIVHAKDVDVEVLGTRFNVNTRHETSTVALEEGKVKLSAKGKLETILTSKSKSAMIEMKPGEVVTADPSGGLELTSDDQIQNNSGWVRNEWHFDSTTLRQVSVMIEDVYGYKTVAADSNLLDIPITGDLRAANINELLAVLQFTSKLTMTKERKTIIVTRP